MASSTAQSTSSTTDKTLRPQELEVPTRNGSIGDLPSSGNSWREKKNSMPMLNLAAKGRRGTDLDDYFTGPLDISKHSKWPFFLRMHGSVLPKMALPLLIVACWSTLITLVSDKKHPLVVSSLLLTVLGFVVGLAISFRTSSAYERYAEGRKYWAQLLFVGQNLARTIWLHSKERDGELGKEDLLAKVTALNLIHAFAVALKHKLRFEPGIAYEDLAPLVGYLDTFAKAAEPEIPQVKKPGALKAAGNYLGIPFSESNPRKRVKRSKKPLGNLPLEVLSYLSVYVDSLIANGNMPVGLYQNQAITSVTTLNDILVSTERVLQTPLPLAYSIAISQITWVYVMLLPFQLYSELHWLTIPGTVVAAYIILGIAAIGNEIENPFGRDVNDLPLDAFCEELAGDLDVIKSSPAPSVLRLGRVGGGGGGNAVTTTSTTAPNAGGTTASVPASEIGVGGYMASAQNKMLWPLSDQGWDVWMRRSKAEMRDALMTKMTTDLAPRRSFFGTREGDGGEGVNEGVREEERKVYLVGGQDA